MVVWVVVVMVNHCERSFFVMEKNGVGVTGVSSAKGSFSSAGLLWIVIFRGSLSMSDLLFGASVVCLGSSTL